MLQAMLARSEEPVILLADDGEDDVLMFRRAFSDVGFESALHVVRHGEETISYLKGEGKYANRDEYPLPTLLLLDLKMPRKNGFEVLEWVRQQPGLRGMLIVVLTTSERVEDINRAYKLGANSFLTKPLNFSEFREMLASLHTYWVTLNHPPVSERPAKDDQSGNGKQRHSNGSAPK
jgi:CheY-like chemotaxis protein